MRVNGLWTMLGLLSIVLPALVGLTAAGCGGDDDDDDDDDDDVDDDDTGDDDIDDDDVIDDDDDDDDLTEGCIEGTFDPYWGVLHAHTSYSDGDDLPSDAFAHARDAAGLDIMVVTDHLEQLYFPFPSDRYGKCQEQADEVYDPGTYLTDCGYEYGSGFELPFFKSTGHNNVFDVDYLFPMIQLDFHDFYTSLIECDTCIGQFNHPGDGDSKYWDDFEYSPEVDEKINLFEYNGDGEVWTLYFLALSKGWHISPMYNQDNHSADWGTKNDRRSGFYLDELTRDSLYTAMQQRRSFMSYDKNASLRMMAEDTCWMGSILNGYSELLIAVEAIDDDEADGFDRIEIYGPGTELLDSIACDDQVTCSTEIDYAITGPTYFVAKAVQTDGDWLVAAPIWVEP